MFSKGEGSTYAAFLGTVLIGGTNFIAVSFSNQELPPFFGATLRFALAAVLFFLIAGVRRVPLARGRQAMGAALYGVLGFGAAYACLYYALVGLPAGTAAVILAAVPLVTHLIAVVLGQEQISWRSLAGGVLVLAGIGVLSIGSLRGDIGINYLLAAILATGVVSASGVVAKALPEVHPVNMNAIGMATGTVMLALGSLIFQEAWVLPQRGQTVLAVAWLVILGSVGLFQLFLYVVRRWTATATVYSIAGMPIIAVVLGWLLLDQAITVEFLIGAAMVMAAVYLGVIAGRHAVGKNMSGVKRSG